jgi:hypothetical protein
MLNEGNGEAGADISSRHSINNAFESGGSSVNESTPLLLSDQDVDADGEASSELAGSGFFWIQTGINFRPCTCHSVEAMCHFSPLER